MKKLETEVKFFLTNRESMRLSILKLGAQSRGRFFETNLRFEDKSKSLIKHKSLLRLRKDNKTTLTFKSSLPVEQPEYKMLKELEVDVSDFTTMTQILEALGFHIEQVYEKWRETFVLGNASFCLDTMPFGDFIEIEGEKDELENFAVNLNLNWKRRIILNYLELFDILRDKLKLPFLDLTFENFKNVKPDVSDYLKLIEVDH